MSKFNNPENQKNQAEDGSTVQIITNREVHNPKPWVVVENAGYENEDIWSDHCTFKAALKELESAGGTENGFDIMKRLDDGTLTTEF
jgi:hypothetical protein